MTKPAGRIWPAGGNLPKSGLNIQVTIIRYNLHGAVIFLQMSECTAKYFQVIGFISCSCCTA